MKHSQQQHTALHRRTLRLLPVACAALVVCATPLFAQSDDATRATQPAAKSLTQSERSEDYRVRSVDRAYPIHFSVSVADQNELITALRNLLDVQTRIFLVPSQNTIVVHAPPEEQTHVAALFTLLDKPHGRYRITFTLAELDGGHRVSNDRFSMTVLNGQRGQLKEGSRIPIAVGEAQYTYIDVGMNFDATFNETEGGGALKCAVDQTSIVPGTIGPSQPNPVIRQTRLEATAPLTFGKPTLLGSLSLPNSTHQLEVEAVVESVDSPAR